MPRAVTIAAIASLLAFAAPAMGHEGRDQPTSPPDHALALFGVFSTNADGSSTITVKKTNRPSRRLVGKTIPIDLSGASLKVADVDGDGSVTVADIQDQDEVYVVVKGRPEGHGIPVKVLFDKTNPASEGHGPGSGGEQGSEAIFFGTFVAGDPAGVTIVRSEAHPDFVGQTVSLDLSHAELRVADVNGDGHPNLADVADGDQVMVKVRLPRSGQLPDPAVALGLFDKTNPPAGETPPPPLALIGTFSRTEGGVLTLLVQQVQNGSAEWVGRTVRVDGSHAELKVADVNGDGSVTFDDVQTGDSGAVKVVREGSTSTAVVASLVYDQTHPPSH